MAAASSVRERRNKIPEGPYHFFVEDYEMDIWAFFFGDNDHLLAENGDIDMVERGGGVKFQTKVLVFFLEFF